MSRPLRPPRRLQIRPRPEPPCLHRSTSPGVARAPGGRRVSTRWPASNQGAPEAGPPFPRWEPDLRWSISILGSPPGLSWTMSRMFQWWVGLRLHARPVPAPSPTASSSWKAGEPEPQLHPCSNERGSLVVKTARQGWAETRLALRARFPVESAHAHSLKRKRTFLARPERRGSPDRRGKRPWVVLRTSSLLPGFPPPAAHRWCRVRLPTEQSD